MNSRIQTVLTKFGRYESRYISFNDAVDDLLLRFVRSAMLGAYDEIWLDL